MAKAAGCNLCVGAIQLPGYGFQYLCNILDTGFLSSIDGRKWQKAFLNGETTLSGSAGMSENIKLLERRRDLGMLNGNGNTFPYEFVAPEGFTIDDSAVYKVVIEGITDKYRQEGNITDTGIVGLDAMKEYLKGFKTLSEKDIIWK